MGLLQKLFFQRTKDWVYATLDPSQTPTDVLRRPIPANTAYISVFLQAMRIVNVRQGLNKFYGTVHSFVTVPHLSGTPAQFNVVVTPNQLKAIDAKHLDRVVTLEKRLLGPVPYRGGDVELEVGLFSIKEADLADSFLSLLERASGLAGVSFIGTALPYADLLADGMNLLIGSAEDSILEVGVSRTLAWLETGYSVIMRAPKQDVDLSRLRIDPNDFRLLDESGQPISDYPYLILKVIASPQREAWFEIPEIATAYRVLNQDLRQNGGRKAQESLAYFRRVTLTCPDLLDTDADRLVKEVEKKVTDVLGPKALTRTKEPELGLPALADIELYD